MESGLDKIHDSVDDQKESIRSVTCFIDIYKKKKKCIGVFVLSSNDLLKKI